MRSIVLLVVSFLMVSCLEQPERDCKSFHDGWFRFEMKVDGVKQTTVFERRGNIEIDHYNGKSDTATIRWVSDCEYVITKLHPKNRAESKAIAMKILTTTKNSYTFEFGEVGNPQTVKGTVTRLPQKPF
ncbi:DNA topoisomerase IV [Flavobacterium silvaticum]|uniref:DNA topoisomerase IV n=1 Tax=Flavobacterium silvaticum TaxID=1852020 RepID=A0A972FQX3_9FLAO|nr:DNA topoisomerase IV [Flavobacterium silvaticum]NMH26843.1 DNA topoisomerase IV [Flavobacterium silvaticum]